MSTRRTWVVTVVLLDTEEDPNDLWSQDTIEWVVSDGVHEKLIEKGADAAEIVRTEALMVREEVL